CVGMIIERQGSRRIPPGTIRIRPGSVLNSDPVPIDLVGVCPGVLAPVIGAVVVIDDLGAAGSVHLVLRIHRVAVTRRIACTNPMDGAIVLGVATAQRGLQAGCRVSSTRSEGAEKRKR